MKDPIQEQLIAARRAQILEAAAKVFAEKGFHPTTIKDIAKEAGIADGTIYNYFANKPALLIGILDRMRASAVQTVDVPADLSQMDVRTFMHLYFRHPLMSLKTNNFELFRVVISEIMVNPELRLLYRQQVMEPTLALAEHVFQQWALAQRIKPTQIPLLTRAISGMVMGLTMEYIMGDAVLEAQWEALPEFLTGLLMDGIGREG